MKERVKIQYGKDGIQANMLPTIDISQETNVSNSQKITQNFSAGFKGFQLSEYSGKAAVNSQLDGSYKLFPTTGYPGLLTREASTGTGDFFNKTVQLKLTDTVPSMLFIVFDIASKEYARNMRIYSEYNGRAIYIEDNNSCIVVVSLEDLHLPTELPEDDLVLGIDVTKWSKPYKSAKITYVSNILDYTYTGTNIIEFTCSENSMTSELTLKPCIVEQYAYVDIYDRDGLIHHLALNNMLFEGNKLRIETDVDGLTKDIGIYDLSKWNVTNSDSVASLTCADYTQTLRKILISDIPLKNRTVHMMFEEVFSRVPGVTWKYETDEVKDRCNRVGTPDNWFESSDAFSILEKICRLAMVCMYWYIDAFIITEADT